MVSANLVIYRGHLDVDLNEIGRHQAVLVADRLSRETNISAIYSSDLNRAFETTNIIASKTLRLQVSRFLEPLKSQLGEFERYASDKLDEFSDNDLMDRHIKTSPS